MTEEAIFAGFGGQGILSMGMILAYAGMMEGKEVCWMPSYGPEMRGGTANAITIISDSLISSPIISTFDTVVALNQPSVDKFESKVKPNGILLYDKTNILKPPTRKDINVYGIPASEEAAKLKNMRVLNMIVLGAFIALKKTVAVETIYEALKKVLPERYHHLIPINQKAFEIGMSLVQPSEIKA
ncbi:MAG TPA: 2-oxoacid:acceptor oxidoreductase family protein [Bacteroidota bacterium]|nr:2-oxoacid:acceptor oxidoreductase family protein [Candidatus Kapabacteria bacterium]HRS00928.1 2-oxoacid:acceptor oxidoreductase family protein [Bacteroidota bacterium]